MALVTQYFKSVLLAALLLVLAAARADALIEPGNLGALPANPYFTQPGVTVNGTLETNQPLGPGGTPQDYLKFTVSSSGETIEFTDQNTSTGIDPHQCDQFCPVYLSLVDSSFTGLGDGSGTVATYGDTEVFDWTFQNPGTYYMVMESDGDVNLGYAASYVVAGGGSAPGTGSPGPGPSAPSRAASPPLVRSLRVLEKQRGHGVTARVRLGQRASLVARVYLTGASKPIASLARTKLKPGPHKLVLRIRKLDWAVVSRPGLSLQLRISVRGASGGGATFTRPVTLSP
jgi:hypothetical protein